MMIKINLLPEEYKISLANADKKEINIFNFSLKIIGAVLGILFLFYILFIYFPLKRNQGLLNKYKQRLNEVQAGYAKAKVIKTRQDRLQAQLNNINKIKASLCWAEKLNDLSNGMPGEIQLINLDLREREEKVFLMKKEKKLVGNNYKIVDTKVEKRQKFYSLDIEGKVVFVGGENKVGRFIENLNKIEIFAKDFAYIKLISISVLNDDFKLFSIRCRFKQEVNSMLEF